MLTSVMFGFGLVFFVLGLLAWLVLGGAYLLVRNIHQDYRRQGGAKKVVPKIVLGTASRYAAMAIRKRFLGF